MVKTPCSARGNMGLIPGWGTKMTHAMQHSQKRERESSVPGRESSIPGIPFFTSSPSLLRTKILT